MEFQDLSEDIIRSILAFCDISTIVSIRRTNKYFHQLTVDKLLWVALVENLWRRGFVDQLSLREIREHSQEALVALVKDLLTGPASWTAPSPDKLPFSARFRPSTSREPQICVEPFAQAVLHPSEIRASKRILLYCCMAESMSCLTTSLLSVGACGTIVWSGHTRKMGQIHMLSSLPQRWPMEETVQNW
ncbi:hypothetical protein C8R43DRAFT_89011 [Mycena crocata]|nr:hypothetical protein C8R43DRAFT_89011 [Mycena crocata]